MISKEALTALVESYGEDHRFFAVMMQIAAKSMRDGDREFAIHLRNLVDKQKVKNAQRLKSIRLDTKQLISRLEQARHDACRAILNLDYAANAVLVELEIDGGLTDDMKTAWTETIEETLDTCATTIISAYTAREAGFSSEEGDLTVMAGRLVHAALQEIDSGPMDLSVLRNRAESLKGQVDLLEGGEGHD